MGMKYIMEEHHLGCKVLSFREKRVSVTIRFMRVKELVSFPPERHWTGC